jgi:hypothetical protein
MNRSILVSIDFSIDSGSCKPKSPTDAKKANKDNAHAGISAKRDLFAFFFIIIALNFLVLSLLQPVFHI